jgi:hypothetical protein
MKLRANAALSLKGRRQLCCRCSSRDRRVTEAASPPPANQDAQPPGYGFVDVVDVVGIGIGDVGVVLVDLGREVTGAAAFTMCQIEPNVSVSSLVATRLLCDWMSGVK